MKKGFALYAVCMASVVLCGIAAASARRIFWGAAISQLCARQHAELSKALCFMQYYDKGIKAHFGPLKALSAKHKNPIVIDAGVGAHACCWGGVEKGVVYINAELWLADKLQCRWRVEKGGEFYVSKNLTLYPE